MCKKVSMEIDFCPDGDASEVDVLRKKLKK
ncbi:hypothetical protein PG102015_0150 [Bifidobacterium pseudolongum subsp. globosum]|nr:hypothetical protein PG102015_0150 [Bifidobacterium pseudolongum subsp. globosum]